MDAERWTRIEELYNAALGHPEEERSSFLNDACGGDDSLRNEVLSLLRCDADEGFLQKSPLEIIARLEAGKESPPAALKAGEIISHYKIINKLGEGGMGVVYKAEDVNLERTVALKFLSPHATGSPGSKTRFIREARASASLDHPNVCTVYEIGEAAGRVFMSMALIEGDRVADRIASRPLKLLEALDIAMQTAQGLHAAHEEGIVHRDIKSSNLMVNRQGRVKIMDFGVAQLADQASLTQSNMIVGTPGCLSPEQAQRLKTDRRSDIWSLGIVLYEMVAGRLPFEGDHAQAVIHAVIHDSHEPLTALRVGVPIELDRIVAKALAKNPDERYQHVDELLVDLRNLARRLQSTVAASAVRAGAAAGLREQNAPRRERRLKLGPGRSHSAAGA